MQNKISRKSAAALGAGLMSLSLTGFAGLLMLAPGANAADGDSTAAVSAEVTTQEICGWNLLGAPGTFPLVPSVAGAEYEGDAFELVANFTNKTSGLENTLNLYVSGTDQSPKSRTTTTACTWYAASGLSPAAPTVEMSFSGTFTSSAKRGSVAALYTPQGGTEGPDTTLSFTPGQQAGLRGGATAAPLVVTPTVADVTACEAADKKFAVEDAVNLSTALEASTLVTMLINNVATKAAEDAGQRCDLGYQVKVTVPAKQLPGNPGAVYSWTGLSLITAMTTATSDPTPPTP